MAFHVGYGGSASVVGALATVTLCVGKWTMARKLVERDEITHSGSAGIARYVPRKVSYTGTVEMPWDDAVLPEAVGLTEGAYTTLRLKLGDSSRYYQIGVLVEDLSFSVDNGQGAVMVTVAWIGNGPPVLR